MALKRDRMEADLDSQDNDRVTPACKAATANSWNQPGPEEVAIQRTLAQDDTVLQPPKIPAATRPRMYAPTKLLEKETKYDLEAILRIVFAGRLCTGGRSVVGGGVGDGGVSAERVGVGGGGRCMGAQEALVPFHLSV
jgi:hypothetical protein